MTPQQVYTALMRYNEIYLAYTVLRTTNDHDGFMKRLEEIMEGIEWKLGDM